MLYIFLRTDIQNSFVYENPWMWLTGAETCSRVCIFVITQFKCLSIVSAYFWSFLSKFFIAFRVRGTGPHFESDECSVRPPPSPSSCFFYAILTLYSHLYEDTNFESLCSFLIFFLNIWTFCMCAKYCRHPLLKHFECTFLSTVET
jgi:hypothetical protein